MYGLTQHYKAYAFTHIYIHVYTCTYNIIHAHVQACIAKFTDVTFGKRVGEGEREKERERVRNGKTEAYDCQKNSLKHLSAK
jgi:hypothetical protein